MCMFEVPEESKENGEKHYLKENMAINCLQQPCYSRVRNFDELQAV